MVQWILLSVVLVAGYIPQLESKHSSVTLALYYESYCPDCISFFQDQLNPALKKLKQHLKLDLVPYGNAEQCFSRHRKRWKFRCQHGKEECKGNTLHACAIHQACGGHRTLQCPLKNLTKVLSYINCVMGQDEISDECAKGNGLIGATIKECARGKLGNKLEHMYGKQTESLPGYAYTPFIVINGKHSDKDNEEAQNDLTKFLCKKYVHC